MEWQYVHLTNNPRLQHNAVAFFIAKNNPQGVHINNISQADEIVCLFLLERGEKHVKA